MGIEIKEKTFRVKGTSLQPYTCKFVRDGNSLRIRCDCPVGMYGEPCEHWMSIFTGEEQEYLDLTDEDILELQSWLDESDLDEALQNLLYFEGHEETCWTTLLDRKKHCAGGSWILCCLTLNPRRAL